MEPYIQPPPLPPKNNSTILWIVLGIFGFFGMLIMVAGLTVAIYVWQPFRVKQLPPRAPEVAEQRRRETSAAFSGPAVAADEAEVAEIRRVLNELRKGFREQDGEKLIGLFDVERMYQEVRRLGGFANVSLKDERDVIKGMRTGIGRNLSTQGELLGFERFEIKRCALNAERNEAVAYVREWADDGRSMKFRWWFIKRNDGWRIYDFQDLDAGGRASDLMAATAKMFAQDPALIPRMQQQMQKYQEVLAAIAVEDFEGARQPLSEIDRQVLPPDLQALCVLFEAAILMEEGKPAEALEACDRAGALSSEMPVLNVLRARAFNALEKYAEAKTAVESYINELSTDAELSLVLGEALLGLEQKDQAAEAYRQGLKDDPNSVDNLYGLARALPEGQKHELGERFAAMTGRKENFKLLCDALLEEEEIEAVKVLIAAYRPLAPDDPAIASYDAHIKSLEGDNAGAAKVIAEALAKITDEEGKNYLVGQYLELMLLAGKPLEAYVNAPDKAQAFVYLAMSLVLESEQHPLLAQLIEARAKDQPDDQWLNYYRGQIELDKKSWAEAEQLLAAGLKAATTDDIRESYVAELSQAMYRQGRGFQAYETLEPQQDAFDHLVWLAEENNDAGLLEKLIAAHREKHPDETRVQELEGVVAWLRKDYATVVDKMAPLRERLLKQQQDQDNPPPADQTLNYRWRIEHHLLLSLIKLQRYDEAQAIAEAVWQRDEAAWYSAYVQAAKGDVEQTLAWLEKLTEQGFSAEDFYADEDFGPLLLADSMRAVREKYPKPEAEGDAP